MKATNGKSKSKRVEIVVAPRETLEQLCRRGKFRPTDILIDSESWNNEPFQCPEGSNELVPHDHDGGHLEGHPGDNGGGTIHDRHPDTLLRLSFTKEESATWFCKTHDFRIVRVSIRGDDYGGKVPQNPFRKTGQLERRGKEVHSGSIRKDAINHQFKIHFVIYQELNGKMQERLIDPDVWCSF